MIVRRVAVCVALALGAACSCSSPKAPPPKQPRWYTAPPKPGASLRSSKQCTCRSCEPVGCCEGSEADPGSTTCGDGGYDFSKCTMSVQSCTGRCFEVAWRVPVDKACASRQPRDCCREP
jgi:hypothetical protein